MSDNTIDERKIILETRLVGDIRGKFVIPSFQRGFRWGKVEVTRLLDDIYTSGTNNYCLQPIVVKPRDGKYRVIDGQQRLTTLFLIYKYLYAATGGFIEEPKFSLSYETRDTSE